MYFTYYSTSVSLFNRKQLVGFIHLTECFIIAQCQALPRNKDGLIISFNQDHRAAWEMLYIYIMGSGRHAQYSYNGVLVLRHNGILPGERVFCPLPNHQEHVMKESLLKVSSIWNKSICIIVDGYHDILGEDIEGDSGWWWDLAARGAEGAGGPLQRLKKDPYIH